MVAIVRNASAVNHLKNVLLNLELRAKADLEHPPGNDDFDDEDSTKQATCQSLSTSVKDLKLVQVHGLAWAGNVPVEVMQVYASVHQQQVSIVSDLWNSAIPIAHITRVC